MLLAYSIYISLLIFMLGCAWKLTQEIRINPNFHYWGELTIIPIITFSICIGLRYNVGLDYISYYDNYDIQSRYINPNLNWEPGFVLLYKTLLFFNAPPYFVFLSVAFIQIILLYKLFKDKVELLPYGILLLFISCYIFGWLNTLRQEIAILLLLISTNYLAKDKTKYFFLYIALATSFHLSSLIFIPVYFFHLSKKRICLENPWILLTIFITCIILQNSLYSSILEGFTFIVNNTLGYQLPEIGGGLEVQEGSGLGKIVNYLIVITLILTLKRLSHEYGFIYLLSFRIFYVGQIMAVIAELDMNLRRLASCYKSASIVLLSYFLFYVFSKWKDLPLYYKISGSSIILIYTIIFLYKIYTGESQCAPFQFIKL